MQPRFLDFAGVPAITSRQLLVAFLVLAICGNAARALIIVEGRGPGPASILGENGELPEYVVSEELEDGTLAWVAFDPDAVDTPKPQRTRNRARVDIELVVDGSIIDLNRMRLPADVVIVDRRFEETDLDGGSR